MVVLLACDLLSCACVGSCILCALIQSGTIWVHDIGGWVVYCCCVIIFGSSELALRSNCAVSIQMLQNRTVLVIE